MKNNSKRYIDYCTGCGLCKSTYKAELKTDEKGFYRPDFLTEKGVDFCSKICPASGKECVDYNGEIWGKIDSYCLGYSSNENIRYNASSGGALTTILIYLLKNHIVDAVIHVAENELDPLESIAVVSETEDEIIKRTGSRYCSTSTLINIEELLKQDKKYVLVGKPCDIVAMRNFAKQNPIVDEKIIYMLSFFCAGAPSRLAQEKLLEKVGCPKDECVHIKYRGNGWPGYATAEDKDGRIYSTTYQEAWSKTLGRDIRLGCRTCIDGIGELADISCCDAWHYDNDLKKTIFKEADGRNLIFARNAKGSKLLKAVLGSGDLIEIKDTYNLNDLKNIQGYQYHRRATLLYAVIALKLCGRTVPNYNLKLLLNYSKKIDLRSKLGVFKGTIIRIMKGRI